MEVLAGANLCGGADVPTRLPKPAPTSADVAYGPHERNVLDLWQAKSATPTPLVIYIHGGAFRTGDKSRIQAQTLNELLAAGISVASINYRFAAEAPLPAAHYDARRALQFVRSRAEEWNVDPGRVGAYGGSAGAQLCLFLAFRDETRDLDSEDPVARESTRLAAVGARAGQTTLDAGWWAANLPADGAPVLPPERFFGDASAEQTHEIAQGVSALNLVSADDPPTFLQYAMAPDDPPPEDPAAVRSWKVHHVVFGTTLKKRMDALGVEVDLSYPGSESRYDSMGRFFIAQLQNRHRETARTLRATYTEEVHLRYLVQLPAGYGSDPSSRWPLILFLHGAGERGDDLERVKVHGPPKEIAAGRDLPFVVVSPQCPKESRWFSNSLSALLDQVLADYRIDLDRVYLTGLSMGGYGTWTFAASAPERFAAIAPICGGGSRSFTRDLTTLPIWAFHGAQDTIILPGESQRLRDRIEELGGNVRLTVYPEADHDSWTVPYAGTELYEWFLSHRRGAPAPVSQRDG